MKTKNKLKELQARQNRELYHLFLSKFNATERIVCNVDPNAKPKVEAFWFHEIMCGIIRCKCEYSECVGQETYNCSMLYPDKMSEIKAKFGIRATNTFYDIVKTNNNIIDELGLDEVREKLKQCMEAISENQG